MTTGGRALRARMPTSDSLRATGPLPIESHALHNRTSVRLAASSSHARTKAALPRLLLWYALAVFTLLAVAVAVYSGAEPTYLFGQIVISASLAIVLQLLSDWPFLNPIQAGALVFYAWFAAAPALTSLQTLLLGNVDRARWQQEIGTEALWVVAAGLIIYAWVARHSLRYLQSRGLHIGFLQPSSSSYAVPTLLALWAIPFLSTLILQALGAAGMQGYEETSYFGGTRVNVWWQGIILALAGVRPMANSALAVAMYTAPARARQPVRLMWLASLAYTLYAALTSGWKSSLMYFLAYWLVAFASHRRRIPGARILFGLCLFLFVIEPFVGFARQQATARGATSSVDRKAIMQEAFASREWLNRSIEQVNVSSLFRGIYPLAGNIARANTWFHGEWAGDTIRWGIDSTIPRVLNPDKRDMNVGNFFYHTVYARTHAVPVSGTLNNVAISIPFEVVANYGLLAGILSFGLLGAWWALICTLILGGSLERHPLSPYLCLAVTAFESPIGHYLASWRTTLILLLVLYGLTVLVRLVRASSRPPTAQPHLARPSA